MANFEKWEDITAQIKESADIVKIIGENVELKKSGVRFLGLCPFHGEKTPSFSVHSGQQFYYCFGCGESGDVFSYMMKYHNLDFPGAVKELARRYQIALPERPLTKREQEKKELQKLMYTVNEKAARIYGECLHRAEYASVAQKYMDERSIPSVYQKNFNIGYAPSVESVGWGFLKNQLHAREIEAAEAAGLLVKKDGGGWYDRFRDRIMFPIQDISGRVCGFGGRIVGEGQPKYMNSPESDIFNKSKMLLGLYQQKEHIRRKNQAVLVEGNFDLISLVVHGCENVAAPLGTALTRSQIRLLHKFAEEVVLLFDGDIAGVKAAVRSMPYFFAEQVKGRVALLPTGHDPDTFVREHGFAELQKIVDRAESLPEFVLEQLIAEHGLDLDGKSRIVEALRPLISAASSPLQRSVAVSHFSEKLGIPAEQFTSLVKTEVKKAQGAGNKERGRVETTQPLTAAQKRLVCFMLMNPKEFGRLEEAGIREALVGGIGEILFLQMAQIEKDGEDLQPEELLSHLPEGAERKLVSEILLEASVFNISGTELVEGDAELHELLQWLKRERLQKHSTRLTQKISQAQETGDFKDLEQLLREKVEVETEMRRG